MQFEIVQKLLHIEKSVFKDRKTQEETLNSYLHFSDPKTTKVSRYRFKGDSSQLVVGSDYLLKLETYAMEGKAGFYLVGLTEEN